MENNLNIKKRVHKVRRPFLNRRADDEQNAAEIDTASRYLNDQVHVLKDFICLAEINRKICAGTQFLNSHYHLTINGIPSQSKILTLNFTANENSLKIPWEYNVKRLESYGDKDLAQWAKHIEKYYTTYPNLMEDYFGLVKSEDPTVSAELRKAKIKATLACQDIESKYSFRKVLAFSSKESTEMLSYSFHEQFLNAMGHTLDSFSDYLKVNGLPTLFQGECPVHLGIAQKFLECPQLKDGIVQEGSEYMSILYDTEGQKREFVVQLINVLEPAAEGFYISTYFVIKSSGTQMVLEEDLKAPLFQNNKIEELKSWGSIEEERIAYKDEEHEDRMQEEDGNMSWTDMRHFEEEA